MALTIGLLVWLGGILLGHVVVPWVISLQTPHHGWTAGRPGAWNLLGLMPLVAGTVCLMWVMVVGFAEIPERVELTWPATTLLVRGPFAFTRNPIYVGELGLWLGWALLYGSLGVFVGFVAIVLIVHFAVLPREERTLEARFGDIYREYKASTSRWVCKPAMP